MEIYPVLGLQAAIEERRAARAFQREPIPEPTLKEILRLGLRAPSGFNLQPWRFIVLRSQESQDKLKACAFDQRQVGEAPVVLICCGDRRAFTSENIEAVIKLGEQEGAMPENYANYMRSSIPGFADNAPSFGTPEVWTNRHTMLAVSQIMVVAKSYGVDSCPMEGFVAEQVKANFNIPESVDVCCLLALGYADEPEKFYGGRFAIEEVCFGESYGQSFSL